LPARPAKAWHWLAFLFASILLVALGWQGKRTQEALLETNRSVSDSLEIITSIQAMLSSLQDIETGARGFMLTADSRYLEPYERGLEQLEWRRRALFEQLRGREYPSWHWFDTLDSTIAARLQVAAQNIQSRRSEGLAITIERLQRSGSKELMDRLRGMLNAVEQHERRRLAAANEAVAQATRHSQRLALIGSLLVALLSLAAFWAVQRNLRIRQRLAEGAQAGEARLDALLQAIPDHLYAVDAHRRVTTLSQGAPHRGPPPDIIEPLLLDLAARHEDGQLRQTLWCEPQTRRIFEVRLMPTGAGEQLAIARDVSELEYSRDSLREQQLFLRRVVDSDENLIFVRDAQGRFLLCNTALAAVLGLQPTDIEGRTPAEVPAAHLLQPLLFGQGELQGGNGELRISEVALTDADGQERWLQVVKRPLRIAPGGTRVVTVAVDISLRRRMEQMKAEFISTVSHELRTPLTAIRGALGMLISGTAGPLDEGLKPLLGIAHKNTERLVRLINDILDIEKLEAGRLAFDLRRCDVRPLLEQALFDLAPYACEYDVSLELAPQAEPFASEARLDADRFTQVMANLLSNAIKHSPRGATVTVDLQRHGQQLEIGVRDRGAGIAEDFRPRIFERFAQADASDARQRGGTGLGLAITRALIEQMGGQIGFDTRAGEGTRFWFRLPLPADAEPPPDTTVVAPEPRASGSGPARILILEPDAAAAAQLAEALGAQGYQAVIAHSAGQARELLGQYVIHALTLSPALDDADSLDFLQNLRSQPRYQQLPVLIVGLQPQRRAEDDGALRGGAVGVIDWLSKPVDPTQVLRVIQACLPPRHGRPRLLHVEDDEDLRTLLARRFEALDVELHGAATLSEARQLLAAQSFDLAIIDLMLPDGSGSELFDQLAQSDPPPPVILFSALDAPVHDSRLTLRQLVKSRHDGEQLARLIQHLLQHWPPLAQPDTDEVHR